MIDSRLLVDRAWPDEEESEATDLIMEGDAEFNDEFIRHCVLDFISDMWTYEDYCLYTGTGSTEEE